MIVIVHESEDGFIADVRCSFKLQSIDLLAPTHLCAADIDFKTVKQVLKNG